MTIRGNNKGGRSMTTDRLRHDAKNFTKGYAEAVLEAAQWIEDGRFFTHPAQLAIIRAQYASPQDKRKRLNIPLAGDLLAAILEKIGVKKKRDADAPNDNTNSTQSTRDSGE